MRDSNRYELEMDQGGNFLVTVTDEPPIEWLVFVSKKKWSHAEVAALESLPGASTRVIIVGNPGEAFLGLLNETRADNWALAMDISSMCEVEATERAFLTQI